MKTLRILLALAVLVLTGGCANCNVDVCGGLLDALLHPDEGYTESWDRAKREAGLRPIPYAPNASDSPRS